MLVPRNMSEKLRFQRAGCSSELEHRKWKYSSLTTNQSFLPYDHNEKNTCKGLKKAHALDPTFLLLGNYLKENT